MRIFTPLHVKSLGRQVSLVLILLFCFSLNSYAVVKSWTGATSTDWNTATNWSPAGAPGPADDVVIGDRAINALRNPMINDWNDYTIKSLTIGVDFDVDFRMAPRSMTITGNVIVGTKGVLWNQGATAYYYGDFTVLSGGVYRESAWSDNNGRGSGSKIWPDSEFLGQGKTINIATNGGGFGNLTISNAIILANTLNIIQVHAYKTNNQNQIITTNRPELTISPSGILDPQGNQVRVKTSTDSRLTPVFTVAEGGTLLVKAATYALNYAEDDMTTAMFPTNLHALGVINYAGTSAQTILPSRQYGVLRISGSANTIVKTLAVPIGGIQTTVASNLFIDAGILDIVNRTLNRATNGGTMNLANGATLRLSESNFPANYAAIDLGPTSTVEYYGAAQAVADVAKGYGNLHLIGSGTKTMPVLASSASLIIAGNLVGSGSAAFTALSNINIAGNVNLSGTASFKGGSFTHTVGGDWINNADYTGDASTVILTGTGKKIERTSATALSATLKNEFNNLQVAGLGTTIAVPAGQSLTVKGNLITTGAGTLSQNAEGLIMSGGTSGTPAMISGSGITLNNLAISGYTTTAASFLVNGNFTTNSGASFIATGGTMTMGTLNNSTKYTILHTGAGTTQFFNLNIARSTSNAVIETSSNLFVRSNLSGNNLDAIAGTITFNGTSTFGGTHKLNDVTIANGTTLTMAAASKMSVKGVFTGLAGNFIATAPNTVIYNGDAQTINNFTYYNLELSKAGAAATKTAAGNTATLGTLTTETGVTLSAGNFTHTLYGDWVHNGVYSGASSNLVFAGTADAKISGPENAAPIVAAGITVNKTAASVVTTEVNLTTNTLVLTNGSISTIKSGIDSFGPSAIKVKVLQSRSGNGWVTGTMTREVAGGFQQQVIVDNRPDERIEVGATDGYSFNGPLVKIIFPVIDANTPNITSSITSISVTSVPQVVRGVTSGVPINRLYKVNVENGAYTKAIFQIQYEESELNGNTEREDEEGLKLASSTTVNNAISWESGLKHDWNIDENRVARKNITDLNRFWTLTDASNLYVWNGSVSDAWEVPANWAAYDATGALIVSKPAPGTSDIVELGSMAPVSNRQPVIRSEAKVKGLQFRPTVSMTLSIDSVTAATPAYSLLVRGNLAAVGTGTANHQIRTANRDLTVNGSLILENDNQVISLKKSVGNIWAKGSINQDKANIYLGSGNLYIGGDYIRNTSGTGKFTTTTGTVIYNGGAAQIVADLPYYNLTIDKTGGAAQLSVTGSKTIDGNLNVANGTFILQSSIVAPGTITVNGNIIIGVTAGTSGTLNATNSNISLAGNWNRANGSFVPGTGSVAFTGSNAQTINSSQFNSLTFSNTSAAGVSLTGNVTVNGDVNLALGALHLGTFTMNRSAVGGTLTLATGTTLDIKGTDNFPNNFSANDLHAASTVLYSGTDVQQVKAMEYGHLQLDGGSSNQKNLAGTTSVRGNLTINTGASFNVNNQTLTLGGNFTIGGTFSPGAYDGTTPPTGTIIFGHSYGVPKIISGNALTVNNMVVSIGAMYEMTSPKLTINGNVDITGEGDFYLNPNHPDPRERGFNNLALATNGYFNARSAEVEIAGDFRSSGVLRSNGTAKFLGNRKQTIQLLSPIVPYNDMPPTVEFAGTVSPIFNSTRTPEFANVTISNREGIVTSVGWGVAGIFTVMPSALFDGGPYTHRLFSAVVNYGTIKSSGVIDFTTPYPFSTAPAAHPFIFGQFVSTGTLRLGGTGQILLAGSISPTLNNLIISNTKGITTTTLNAGYILNIRDWNLNGNLIIESGGILNAIPSVDQTLTTKFNIKGDLINNGAIVSRNPSNGSFFGIGANFTFTDQDSKITGTGTSMLGNLIVANNSKLTVNKNISVYSNLVHNGSAFNAGSSTVSFIGAGPSEISAPAGMAANPKVPLSLSNVRVAKEAQTTKVALKTNIDKLLSISVETGILDIETNEVVAHPDITETIEGVTSTTPVNTTITALDGATIKVGGTSTLPAADVFNLAAASTVEYYGASQQVKSVQYGNLALTNTGTATFEAGTASIAGNLTVKGESTQQVVTPATVEFNGTGNQTIAPLAYQNLTLSTGGTKTFAAKLETGDNKVLSISGAVTKAEGVAVDANDAGVTVEYNGTGNQDVLPVNYYNLTLSTGGLKTFSQISGVANALYVSGATADMTTNDATLDFNGTGSQNIPGRINYNKLLVSAGGNKILLDDTEISKELNLTNGTITTNGKIFTLAPTAQIIESEGNSVTGKVQTTRTLTTAAETFGGMGLEITAAVAPGSVTVIRETGLGAAITGGTGNKSINRNFTFVSSSSGGGANSQTVTQSVSSTNLDATVVFKYFDSELNGLQAEEAELRLHNLVQSVNGDQWVKHSGAAPNTYTNSLTSTGINSLTRMTLGSNVTPLPVELLSFTASKQGNNANLKWTTASEQNNSGFEVQASTDGVTYEKIGFVKSRVGSSSVKQEYSFTDSRNGKNGVQYYRLKQIDFDGTFKLYGPKAIDFGTVTQIAPAIVYPNPFADKLSVLLETPLAGIAKFKLYTATGKLLKEENVMVQAGKSDQRLELATGAYEPGLYMLVIELNHQRQTIKLMKE